MPAFFLFSKNKAVYDQAKLRRTVGNGYSWADVGYGDRLEV